MIEHVLALDEAPPGSDPRFSDAEFWKTTPRGRSGDPPPGSPSALDCYLFAWDRLRAIRKDFTLQNYRPDGERCDRVAVAVYEKMARYLLVIEHQMVGLHDAEGNESWRQNAGHGKQNANVPMAKYSRTFADL